MKKASLAALVAALAVAGCGGGNDEDKVREVVNQLGASDPVVCDKATDKFLENFGGSVERCKKEADDDANKEAVAIKKVTIDGDNATVQADVGGDAGTAKLVKEDGDWKIDSVAASTGSSSGGGGAPGETEAKATLDAFFNAVKEENAQVVCGLMSPRLAKEILGKPNAEFAIADCVKAFERSDNWEPFQREVRGVTTEDISVSGSTATVELSNNETADLKKDGDRFVIDDIE